MSSKQPPPKRLCLEFSDDAFKCPICNGRLTSPVVASNGLTYCHACIGEHFADNEGRAPDSGERIDCRFYPNALAAALLARVADLERRHKVQAVTRAVQANQPVPVRVGLSSAEARWIERMRAEPGETEDLVAMVPVVFDALHRVPRVADDTESKRELYRQLLGACPAGVTPDARVRSASVKALTQMVQAATTAFADGGGYADLELGEQIGLFAANLEDDFNAHKQTIGHCTREMHSAFWLAEMFKELREFDVGSAVSCN